MSFEIISDLDQTTSNTQLYSLEIVLQMWTLCTMQIKEDMDTMFKEDSLPLGHRRKMEVAILNLQKAAEPGTAIINKSLEADESQTHIRDR
jgi:hypothetical protein